MSVLFYGSDGTNGTVSVTNGSKTVTGSGTGWLTNNAVPSGGGYMIKLPDGNVYGIASIASDTSLTLTDNYAGSTTSGAAYYIVPSNALLPALLNSLSTLLNSSNFSQIAGLVPNSGDFIEYLSSVWTNRSPAQVILSLFNSLSAVNVASATTCDIGAATSPRVQITGTTTITSFGTQANALRIVRFGGALTLTHNATSLILLGAASRTTAAGDVGIYLSDSSGNWREHDYSKANGSVVSPLQVVNDIGSARNALTNFSNISVTGLSSATELMGGFGSTLKLTPAFSGRVRVKLIGYSSNDTVSANTIFRGRYGTGSAPSALASATGTAMAGFMQTRNAVTSQSIPYSYEVELSGLTVGNAYWFDLSIETTLSATCAVTIVSAIIEEF